MENTCAIILAAGEGKRMKSNSPKVLSEVLFKPILQWVIDSLSSSSINNVCVVCGYKHEQIEEYLKNTNANFSTVLQKEQLGTAHAVITASDFLKDNIEKDVLVLCGDAPFIDSETIIASLNFHRQNHNSATVFSAKVNNPFGYGRIVRDKHNKLLKIVEQKDTDEKTSHINEVNSSIYWFNVKDLLSVIYNISNKNAQSEFYLPDAIELLISNGKSVDAFVVENENVILGANDKVQLQQLNKIAREKVLNKLMLSGVNIPFPDGVVICDEARIGTDVTILPNTIIQGKTIIGNNCTIGPNVLLDSCSVPYNKNLSFKNLKNCTV